MNQLTELEEYKRRHLEQNRIRQKKFYYKNKESILLKRKQDKIALVNMNETEIAPAVLIEHAVLIEPAVLIEVPLDIVCIDTSLNEAAAPIIKIKLYTIYKLHTNDDKNRIYIGITTTKPKDRFIRHKSDYRTNKNRCRSAYMFKTYGESNVIMSILEENISKDIIKERETYWINLYPNTVNSNLNFPLMNN